MPPKAKPGSTHITAGEEKKQRIPDAKQKLAARRELHKTAAPSAKPQTARKQETEKSDS